MPLVTSKELLIQAQKEGYAIGAFNANNMECIQAVIEAAEAERAPVILQISQGAMKHGNIKFEDGEYGGLELDTAMVKTVVELANVPVVLHLDHGTDFEQNVRCLRAGFTSLMYDGSNEPLEKNIQITAKIAEIAHACNIPVEAELGKITKIEDFFKKGLLPSDFDFNTPLSRAVKEEVWNLMARPEDTERFVQSTGCDSLAAAIGSVHGMKRDIQPVRIDRLLEIKERTKLPIVLHGSSGVIQTREDAERLREEMGLVLEESEGTLEDAIKAGICKVNIATEVSMSFLRGVKAEWERRPKEKDFRPIFAAGREEAKRTIQGYMRLFGCSGKAEKMMVQLKGAVSAPEGPE